MTTATRKPAAKPGKNGKPTKKALDEITPAFARGLCLESAARELTAYPERVFILFAALIDRVQARLDEIRVVNDVSHGRGEIAEESHTLQALAHLSDAEEQLQAALTAVDVRFPWDKWSEIRQKVDEKPTKGRKGGAA